MRRRDTPLHVTGVHAGIGLGEGSGREPGRAGPRTLLHAASAVGEIDELNAWLLDKCNAYAKVHRHPELTEQTIWECQLAWSSYSDRDWQPVQNNAFTGGTWKCHGRRAWSALDVATNTSEQIRSRLENSRADVILIIATLGWVDTRGK